MYLLNVMVYYICQLDWTTGDQLFDQTLFWVCLRVLWDFLFVLFFSAMLHSFQDLSSSTRDRTWAL